VTVPSPAGMPAWEWLLGLVIIGGVTLVVTWLQTRPMRKSVRQVAADARETRDQTANTHDKNLRDDLDEKDEGVHAALANVIEELRETRRDIGGIRSELRGVQDDVREVRKTATVTDRRVRDIELSHTRPTT